MATPAATLPRKLGQALPAGRPGWLRRHRASLIDIAQFAVLAGALVWLAVRGAAAMGYAWQWNRVPRYLYRIIDGEVIWGPLMRGLFVTIEISLWAMALTLVFGLATTLLRRSSSLSGRFLASTYLELIRNTPLLVQLYLAYFVLSPILGIGRTTTGILALAAFEGAFAAEIIRAGIEAVQRGQWDAARSLGLSLAQTYRLVVLPQAVQMMLPPMAGLFVSLIKHSAIVSTIAIFDLTNEARNVIAETFMSFEIWLTVAAMYLVLTISLSVAISRFEQRLKRKKF
jgi:polar amino acid transport system permease protein